MPNYLREDKPLCGYPKERMPNRLNSGHIRCCYDWPGNVRELEQATRRTLLARSYAGESPTSSQDRASQLSLSVAAGTLDTGALPDGDCYGRGSVWSGDVRCELEFIGLRR